MKRFIVLHESRTYADGWLLWFIVVLGALLLALALATTAAAGTAYFSFQGSFTDGSETQSFLFNTDAAIGSPETFSLRTWHYTGGTNAAGDSILSGGFDPILRLYSGETLAAVDDDIDRTVFNYDAELTWRSADYSPSEIAIRDPFRTGDYRLDLRTLSGGGTHWAVDLVGPADKLTLTGVEQINNTGATTINSLKMGGNDPLAPASLQLGPLENLSILVGLVVGNTGSGEVTVTTGSLSSSNGYVYLGLAAESVGSVTLSLGGYLEATSSGAFSAIGFAGEGNLRVESGSLAVFNYLDLGELSGAEGNVTVTGNDSYLVVNGGLFVSEFGVGYLRVQDKGQVNSAGTVLGFSTGGHGTGEVDGLDSLWHTNDLFVGNYGQGTVRITSGGKIDTTGNAYIGKTADGHDSSVTLTGTAPDGTPSTWQVSGNLSIAGNESGASNATNSKLTINPGGLVDVADAIIVWNPGGSVQLLGGELETGSLVVKPGATFTHHDGTLTVNAGTFDPGTGASDYVITGADSVDRPKVVLTNTANSVLPGWLIVGQDNYGELTIENGATLTAANVGNSFAPAAPASGKIIVQGAGSRLVVTSPAMSHHSLMIGTNGPGELTVSAGGQVHVQNGGASLACCFNAAGVGTGAITIEGPDSLLEAKYVNFRASGGDSSVTIRDYGVVRATDSSYVNLIAPVSIISLNTLSVDITSGGRLELAGQLDIGSSGGDTKVSIDGASAGQAALTVNGPLNIGYSTNFGLGSTRFTVTNGGLVSADSVKVWQPGTVELNSNGIISTGNFELAGGKLQGIGTVLVSGQLVNAGVVSPGVLAPALSTDLIIVDGDYTENLAGELDIEIGGTSPYDYDRLIIENGSASLHGKLAVSLIDTGGGTDVFQPSAGEMFEILIAADGLGGSEFATKVLPALRGGLYFGVLYNPNDVTLVAAGVLGDYNRNGAVDAADYVVWRDTFGGPNVPASSLAADGDGDGDVDGNDHAVWRSHFGQTAGSGALSSSNGALPPIPEPASLLLLALACCVTFLWRERGRRHNAPFGMCGHSMVLAALIFSVSSCPARAGVVYDAAGSFSSTNNPHGAWSYGWSASLGSEFHLYPTPVTGSGLNSWYDPPIAYLGAPAVGHNPTANTITSGTVSILAGQLVSHPGNLGQFSVVRWSASMDGSIDIGAAFTGRDLWGTTTDVHVLHNGTSLFDGIVNGFATGPPPFETTRTVLAGDTVDFSVGRNGTFWNDTTGIYGVINFDAGVFLSGDYNQNGTVDAADYVAWRTNLNTNNVLPNDPIGGTIGPPHFEQWRSHFGQTAASGALATVSQPQSDLDRAIPEPATLALLLIGGALLAAPMRRAGSRVTHRSET